MCDSHSMSNLVWVKARDKKHFYDVLFYRLSIVFILIACPNSSNRIVVAIGQECTLACSFTNKRKYSKFKGYVCTSREYVHACRKNARLCVLWKIRESPLSYFYNNVWYFLFFKWTLSVCLNLKPLVLKKQNVVACWCVAWLVTFVAHKTPKSLWGPT